MLSMVLPSAAVAYSFTGSEGALVGPLYLPGGSTPLTWRLLSSERQYFDVNLLNSKKKYIDGISGTYHSGGSGSFVFPGSGRPWDLPPGNYWLEVMASAPWEAVITPRTAIKVSNYSSGWFFYTGAKGTTRTFKHTMLALPKDRWTRFTVLPAKRSASVRIKVGGGSWKKTRTVRLTLRKGQSRTVSIRIVSSGRTEKLTVKVHRESHYAP